MYTGWRKQDGCLIVSRLYTHSRVHHIVAVTEALVLLPISYVVRIANYRVSWKLVLDKDQFLMTDSSGNDVPVTEQEDLTFISNLPFGELVMIYFTLQTRWKEWIGRMCGSPLRAMLYKFKPFHGQETVTLNGFCRVI